MPYAAEHRQRDQLAFSGQPHPELRVRIGNRVQCLRWAPTVVVGGVLPAHAQDTPDVQEERLLA